MRLFNVFSAASWEHIRYRRTIDWAEDIPSFGGELKLEKYREDVNKGRGQVLAMLGEARRSLEEWLSDLGPVSASSLSSAPGPAASNRKVFIVHGHDELPREAVARFLEAIDFEVVILNERASGNRTIIEKIEANSDAVTKLYAFVRSKFSAMQRH